MSFSSNHPRFGAPRPGRKYVPRPGAYAVIIDDQGQLAVVRYRGKYFLPGGGLDGNESHREALHREIMEETGWAVTVLDEIGRADEYVESPAYDASYLKMGTFFEARVEKQLAQPTEPDHEFIWVSPAEFTAGAAHQSHVWAVNTLLNRHGSD